MKRYSSEGVPVREKQIPVPMDSEESDMAGMTAVENDSDTCGTFITAERKTAEDLREIEATLVERKKQLMMPMDVEGSVKASVGDISQTFQLQEEPAMHRIQEKVVDVTSTGKARWIPSVVLPGQRIKDISDALESPKPLAWDLEPPSSTERKDALKGQMGYPKSQPKSREEEVTEGWENERVPLVPRKKQLMVPMDLGGVDEAYVPGMGQTLVLRDEAEIEKAAIKAEDDISGWLCVGERKGIEGWGTVELPMFAGKKQLVLPTGVKGRDESYAVGMGKTLILEDDVGMEQGLRKGITAEVVERDRGGSSTALSHAETRKKDSDDLISPSPRSWSLEPPSIGKKEGARSSKSKSQENLPVPMITPPKSKEGRVLDGRKGREVPMVGKKKHLSVPMDLKGRDETYAPCMNQTLVLEQETEAEETSTKAGDDDFKGSPEKERKGVKGWEEGAVSMVARKQQLVVPMYFIGRDAHAVGIDQSPVQEDDVGMELEQVQIKELAIEAEGEHKKGFNMALSYGEARNEESDGLTSPMPWAWSLELPSTTDRKNARSPQESLSMPWTTPSGLREGKMVECQRGEEVLMTARKKQLRAPMDLEGTDEAYVPGMGQTLTLEEDAGVKQVLRKAGDDSEWSPVGGRKEMEGLATEKLPVRNKQLMIPMGLEGKNEKYAPAMVQAPLLEKDGGIEQIRIKGEKEGFGTALSHGETTKAESDDLKFLMPLMWSCPTVVRSPENPSRPLITSSDSKDERMVEGRKREEVQMVKRKKQLSIPMDVEGRDEAYAPGIGQSLMLGKERETEESSLKAGGDEFGGSRLKGRKGLEDREEGEMSMVGRKKQLMVPMNLEGSYEACAARMGQSHILEVKAVIEQASVKAGRDDPGGSPIRGGKGQQGCTRGEVPRIPEKKQLMVAMEAEGRDEANAGGLGQTVALEDNKGMGELQIKEMLGMEVGERDKGGLGTALSHTEARKKESDDLASPISWQWNLEPASSIERKVEKSPRTGSRSPSPAELESGGVSQRRNREEVQMVGRKKQLPVPMDLEGKDEAYAPGMGQPLEPQEETGTEEASIKAGGDYSEVSRMRERKGVGGWEEGEVLMVGRKQQLMLHMDLGRMDGAYTADMGQTLVLEDDADMGQVPIKLGDNDPGGSRIGGRKEIEKWTAREAPIMAGKKEVMVRMDQMYPGGTGHTLILEDEAGMEQVENREVSIEAKQKNREDSSIALFRAETRRKDSDDSTFLMPWAWSLEPPSTIERKGLRSPKSPSNSLMSPSRPLITLSKAEEGRVLEVRKGREVPILGNKMKLSVPMDLEGRDVTYAPGMSQTLILEEETRTEEALVKGGEDQFRSSPKEKSKGVKGWEEGEMSMVGEKKELMVPMDLEGREGAYSSGMGQFLVLENGAEMAEVPTETLAVGSTGKDREGFGKILPRDEIWLPKPRAYSLEPPSSTKRPSEPLETSSRSRGGRVLDGCGVLEMSMVTAKKQLMAPMGLQEMDEEYAACMAQAYEFEKEARMEHTALQQGDDESRELADTSRKGIEESGGREVLMVASKKRLMVPMDLEESNEEYATRTGQESVLGEAGMQQALLKPGGDGFGWSPVNGNKEVEQFAREEVALAPMEKPINLGLVDNCPITNYVTRPIDPTSEGFHKVYDPPKEENAYYQNFHHETSARDFDHHSLDEKIFQLAAPGDLADRFTHSHRNALAIQFNEQAFDAIKSTSLANVRPVILKCFKDRVAQQLAEKLVSYVVSSAFKTVESQRLPCKPEKGPAGRVFQETKVGPTGSIPKLKIPERITPSLYYREIPAQLKNRGPRWGEEILKQQFGRPVNPHSSDTFIRRHRKSTSTKGLLTAFWRRKTKDVRSLEMPSWQLGPSKQRRRATETALFSFSHGPFRRSYVDTQGTSSYKILGSGSRDLLSRPGSFQDEDKYESLNMSHREINKARRNMGGNAEEPRIVQPATFPEGVDDLLMPLSDPLVPMKAINQLEPDIQECSLSLAGNRTSQDQPSYISSPALLKKSLRNAGELVIGIRKTCPELIPAIKNEDMEGKSENSLGRSKVESTSHSRHHSHSKNEVHTRSRQASRSRIEITAKAKVTKLTLGKDMTEEVTRRAKAAKHARNNLLSPTGRAISALSPSMGWKKQGKIAVNDKPDVEDLVNSYVEIVCEDFQNNAKNRQQEEEKSAFYISPENVMRMRWDVLMLVLIAYTSYSIPYRMAFSQRYDTINFLIDMISDILFLVDVALNFVTGYKDAGGIMQENIKVIAAKYLRTWFAIDFLSAFPFDYVYEAIANNQNSWIGDILKGLRILKLFRLIRFIRYSESKEAALYFTPSMLRLGNTILFLFWVWHVITCGFWYIANHEGLGTTDWTPDVTHLTNTNMLNYMLSFQWTLQTTFSFGAPGFPETYLEVSFTISAVLIGIFMNAYVIGSASSALQSMDAEKIARRQQLDRIITYMKKRKLPPYFQRIILDFYEYFGEKASEDNILTDLPSAIQQRLALLLNRELVQNIPTLKQLDLDAILFLMQNMTSHTYLPGEFVYKAKEQAKYLYFVKTGQLEVLLDNEAKTTVQSLMRGDMFGQSVIAPGEEEEGEEEEDENYFEHNTSVRAVIYSEVLALEYHLFKDLINENGKFLDVVQRSATVERNRIIASTNNQKNSKIAKFTGNDESGQNKKKKSNLSVASVVNKLFQKRFR